MRGWRSVRQLVAQMAAGLGRSTPFACRDWAATKAAYRLFSNERIREEQIPAGHLKQHDRGFPQPKCPF